MFINTLLSYILSCNKCANLTLRSKTESYT